MRSKTFITVSAIALVTLAGCSKPAPAPEATASADAVTAAPSDAAAWTPVLPPPGSYNSTTSDGKPYSKVTLNADGSYSRDPEQGLNEAGIVKMTDGKLCFDPSGKDNPERCYTMTQPAADGGFTVTDSKGVTLNVKPAAS